MYSLKVKLIIITVGIFIVFDDTNADIDFTGCIDKLISDGYYSKDDGIANYVNLFSKFVDKYHMAIARFDELILNTYAEVEEKKLNFLDQLYTHQMLPEIMKIKMDNADIWCTSNADNISMKSGGSKEGNPVESCKVELKTRGFIYKHGITNYAFFNKQPSLLKFFTDDLRKVPTTSNDWCINYSTNGNMKGYSDEARNKFEASYKDRPEVFKQTLFDVCVGILIVHGFNRTADENRDFLMAKTQFIEEYIKYIAGAAKGLIDSALIPGTSKWCLDTCLKKRPKEEDEFVKVMNCQKLINKPLKEINTNFTLVV